MKFDHRIAVVTGAAGRIGRSLAEKLCAEGVAVALADLAADKAEAVAGRRVETPAPTPSTCRLRRA